MEEIRVETLKNIRGIVKEILETDKEARNSDRYLINEYYKKKYPSIRDWTFERVMTAELDSFESIGRMRRKLQEEFPELRPDKEHQKKKNEMEQIVKEFVR